MRELKDIKIILAGVFLGVIVLTSIFAAQVAPYNPFMPNMANRLLAPNQYYWLGTDALGRDMLSRIIYGGRASIVLSIIASLISLLFGMLMGVLAGFYRGKVDLIINILSNIVEGIPGTCFMVAIIGCLGPSISSLLIALSLVSWASFSRIVRAEVLKINEEPFIEGLICIGCSNRRLILYHIFPNIFNNLVVLFTIRLARSFLAVAGLSFLGLGVQPPTPDWSVMINDAMLYYRGAPHLIIVPGLMIFLVAYAINIIGEALRDSMDVKSQEVR